MLDKRAGLNLVTDDVFVNVAGGMRVDEPAADLAVLAAVASSLRNKAIEADVVIFGEVGLAGEVRATSQAALRVREAAQMGFTRCVVAGRQYRARGSAAGHDGDWGPNCRRGARRPADLTFPVQTAPVPGPSRLYC